MCARAYGLLFATLPTSTSFLGCLGNCRKQSHSITVSTFSPLSFPSLILPPLPSPSPPIPTLPILPPLLTLASLVGSFLLLFPRPSFLFPRTPIPSNTSGTLLVASSFLSTASNDVISDDVISDDVMTWESPSMVANGGESDACALLSVAREGLGSATMSGSPGTRVGAGERRDVIRTHASPPLPQTHASPPLPQERRVIIRTLATTK